MLQKMVKITICSKLYAIYLTRYLILLVQDDNTEDGVAFIFQYTSNIDSGLSCH
jgi:hypothetical protein